MTPPPAAVLFNVLFADSLVADIKHSVNEAEEMAPLAGDLAAQALLIILFCRARVSIGRPCCYIFTKPT